MLRLIKIHFGIIFLIKKKEKKVAISRILLGQVKFSNFIWRKIITKEFLSTSKTKTGTHWFRAIQDIDPCAFVSESVICILYVDDTLLSYSQSKTLSWRQWC